MGSVISKFGVSSGATTGPITIFTALGRYSNSLVGVRLGPHAIRIFIWFDTIHIVPTSSRIITVCHGRVPRDGSKSAYYGWLLCITKALFTTMFPHRHASLCTNRITPQIRFELSLMYFRVPRHSKP